mmetsp:Transcript_3159/g.4567  ORF Transcript_3159/g.4567 Transcript_3159/m.4567 type:complete len:269 (+) Transcript_3159:71-877(+)
MFGYSGWYTVGAVAVAIFVLTRVNKVANFIFHFFIFGQILPLVALFSYPFCRLVGICKGPPNNTVSDLWARICVFYFRCKFKNVDPTNKLYTGQCMYICPHRSWSDFFVHRRVVDGHGSNLSRWMVLAAFPLFYVVTKFDRSVFWFNRSKARGNSSVFYAWMKKELDASHLPAVINYPEGTRNIKNTALPLKRGGIYFAYQEKLPLQVVMSKGNDDIVNEKGFKMGFNKLIEYKYGPVIEAKDFETREEYFEHVEKCFLDMFKELYGE